MSSRAPTSSASNSSSFVTASTSTATGSKSPALADAAFERPALDAVRQWKFEPGLKGGQRVGCKMRVPIRFKP